jgi:hypothetical protein
MGMTVKRLYRMLGALIDEGHGNRKVCVDKPSFQHNLEADGCVILEVNEVQTHTYPLIDGDGHHVENNDGSERMLTSVVLVGDGGPTWDAT